MSNTLNISISASLLQSSLNALTGKDINEVEYALSVLVTAATTSPFIKTLILRDNRKKLCNALLACAAGNLRSSSSATLSALEIMVAVADASSVFTRNANTEIGIRPLLTLLKKPNQIELIMELSCTLLLVMAKNNKKFGLTMRLEGGVLLVCSVLASLSVDTVSLFLKLCQVLEKCCRELSTYTSPSNFTSTIVTYNDNNIKVALKKGIPVSIIEFIRANQTYAMAVETGLNLLSILCGTNDQYAETIKDAVPSSQLFSMLTSILRYHHENMNVCLATFKFMNALAADPDTCVKLCAANVFTQGWNAAVHHAHDTEVLQTATSAMWRIVTGLHRFNNNNNNNNNNNASKGSIPNNNNTNNSSHSSVTSTSTAGATTTSLFDEAKLNNTVAYLCGYCPLSPSLFRDNILKSVHGHSILVGNQPILPNPTNSSLSSIVWEGLPPATITLWPLPRYYGGDNNNGNYVMNLMNTMHGLPRWAGPYLPRTGYYPSMPNYNLTIKTVQLTFPKLSALPNSSTVSVNPTPNTGGSNLRTGGTRVVNDKVLTVNTAIAIKGLSSSAPSTPIHTASNDDSSADTVSFTATTTSPYPSHSSSPSNVSNHLVRPRSGGTRSLNRWVNRLAGSNDTSMITPSVTTDISSPTTSTTTTETVTTENTSTIDTLSANLSSNLILAADRPLLSPGKRVRTIPSFVTRGPKVSLEITGIGGVGGGGGTPNNSGSSPTSMGTNRSVLHTNDDNNGGNTNASMIGGKPFRMLTDALEHARSSSPTKSTVGGNTHVPVPLDRSPMGKDPLLYPQQGKMNPVRLSILPSSSTHNITSSSSTISYHNLADGFIAVHEEYPLEKDSSIVPSVHLPPPSNNDGGDDDVPNSVGAPSSTINSPSSTSTTKANSILRPTVLSPSSRSNFNNRDEAFSIAPFNNPPGPMTIISAWESTRIWLHTPHWYPELQLSASLLPEVAFMRNNEIIHRSLDEPQIKSVISMCEETIEQGRASVRGVTILSNRTGSVTVRRTPLRSMNTSMFNSVKTTGFYPASNIPKISCEGTDTNVNLVNRLQDMSMTIMQRSIRSNKYFFNPHQILNERRIPTVPGLPIALTSNGFTIDRNHVNIRIPRVYLTRSGMATVRRMVVPPSKLPTAFYCQPPMCEVVLDRRIISTGSTMTNIVKNTGQVTMSINTIVNAKTTLPNNTLRFPTSILTNPSPSYPPLMHPLAKGYLLLRTIQNNNNNKPSSVSSSSPSSNFILPPVLDDSLLNDQTFFKHKPGGMKMDAPEPMVVCTSDQRASVAARLMLREIARAGVAAGQLMQHRLVGVPTNRSVPSSNAEENKRSCLNALDTHYSSNSSSNLGSATSSRRGSSSDQHILSPSATLPFEKPQTGITNTKSFLTLSRLVYHRYTHFNDQDNTMDTVPAIALSLPNPSTDNTGGLVRNIYLTRANFAMKERTRPNLPYRNPFIGYAVPIGLNNGTDNGNNESSSSVTTSLFCPDTASVYDTLSSDEALIQMEPGPTCPLPLSGSTGDDDRRVRSSNGGKDDDEDSQFSEEDEEESRSNTDGTDNANITNDENSSIDDNSIDDKDKNSVDDQPTNASTDDTLPLGSNGSTVVISSSSTATVTIPSTTIIPGAVSATGNTVHTVDSSGITSSSEKQILGSLTDALIPSAIAAHNNVVQAKLVREAVNRADVTAILSEAADEVAAMLTMHQKVENETLSLPSTDFPSAPPKAVNDATTLRAQMMAAVPPLEFESRFECGNLASAVRIGPFEYELTLDPDTNTGGHTQWFFFRVRNMVGTDATLTVEHIDPKTGIPQYQRIPLYPEPRSYLDSTDLQPIIPGHNVRATLERNEKSLQQPPACVYRFHIVNLEKGGSTFNDGMRPLVYFETAPSGKTAVTNPVPRKEWRKKWYPQPPPIPGLEHIIIDDDDDEEEEEKRKKESNENKNVPNAQYIPSPATSSSYHVPTLPGAGWRRAGFDIVYYRNQYSRLKERVHPPVMDEEGGDMTSGTVITYQPPDNPGIPYDEIKPTSQYSQTWSIAFPEGIHTAFFAYCFPYTYTDLRRDMVRWESRAERLSTTHVPSSSTLPLHVPIREWDDHAVGSEIDNLHLDDMDNDTVQQISKSVMSDIATSLPSGTFIPPGYTTIPQPFATRISSSLPLPLSVPIGSQYMSSIMHRTVLCTTLAGNPVPLLTITDFTSGPAALALRPYIVLSARVHPGETNGSWMMRGVIDMLTSSAPIATELRKRVIFKIIPFLNPDGVINGHHRTGLAGLDLNRHWTNPDINKAPTIWHLRTLIMSIQSRAASQALIGTTDTLPLDQSIPNDIQYYPPTTDSLGSELPMDYTANNSVPKSSSTTYTSLPILPTVSQPCIFFCDFHGHSRRRNVFTFGCHELPYSGEPFGNVHSSNTDTLPNSNAPGSSAYSSSRTFPKLLASRIDTFAFGDCSWKVQKDKANCARVAMWRDALLPSSYTIEASFAGPDTGTQKGIHFTTRQYEEVGYAFVASLLDFVEGPLGTRMSMTVQRLRSDNTSTNPSKTMNDENTNDNSNIHPMSTSSSTLSSTGVVNNNILHSSSTTTPSTTTTAMMINTNSNASANIQLNSSTGSIKNKVDASGSSKPSLLKKIGRKKPVQDAEIIIYGGKD